ncbi:MAG: HEAT repeat domain-containing protein [Planctomycetes bacterium]|jgi:HEAT repeat protein|nr:HEAT repeat domain-containing protein [Planctomycetota bacterium]HPY73910.1 HEAT repeat domain-containing protein [Planctomycetota bacterium]HQA99533.1 HEAT repeat domain-containing protein [Planctomycetota bacterium]
MANSEQKVKTKRITADEKEKELQQKIIFLEKRLHDTEKLVKDILQQTQEQKLETSFHETFSPWKTLTAAGRFIINKQRWSNIWIHCKNLFFWSIQRCIDLGKWIGKYFLLIFQWLKTLSKKSLETYGIKKVIGCCLGIFFVIFLFIWQPWSHFNISISITKKGTDEGITEYTNERITEYNGKTVVYPEETSVVSTKDYNVVYPKDNSIAYHEKRNVVVPTVSSPKDWHFTSDPATTNPILPTPEKEIVPEQLVAPKQEQIVQKPVVPISIPPTFERLLEPEVIEQPDEADRERLADLFARSEDKKSLLNRVDAISDLAEDNSLAAAHQLMILLDDEHPDIQWQAARGLSKMKKRYVPAAKKLAKIVQDKSYSLELRKEVIVALGSMGSVYEQDLLFQILNNPKEDEEFRNNAITALSLIGDGEIAGKLMPFLDDPSISIRQSVITTLGNFSYPFATNKLLQILDTEKDYNIRKETIQALGKITDKAPQIVSYLVEAWHKEKDESLKIEIRNSISALLSSKEIPTEVVEEAHKILIK